MRTFWRSLSLWLWKNCHFIFLALTYHEGNFISFVYHKPTLTGLFTNFHSFVPLAYKRSVVSCLLLHTSNLCCSYEKPDAQLEVCRNLFTLNDFRYMLDRIVLCFFDNAFDPKPFLHTVPKKLVYLCLLLTGSHFLQIRTQTTRIASFLRSGVVYMFKCRCCFTSYVGQATRIYIQELLLWRENRLPVRVCRVSSLT